ncbi:MAG: hypothetical protein ACREYF_18895, partial [Gammaproteobacteria bacterium]
MTCIRLILLTALIASGCTTAPVQEEPVQATAAPTPPCQKPAHLVRDLTVPWSVRTYIIAPCGRGVTRREHRTCGACLCGCRALSKREARTVIRFLASLVRTTFLTGLATVAFAVSA